MNVRAVVGGRAVPVCRSMVMVRRLVSSILGMTQRVGIRVLSGFDGTLVMYHAVSGEGDSRLQRGGLKAHEQ